tara:strand:- start:110 stop:382 length:273 start_codon:yes stop_codon:yes gene_type:complete
MHIITIKGMSQEGAYAVMNEFGEKVVFMFEEQDDAYRYAEQLEAQGDPKMVVIHVKDNVAIAACERTGTRYTVIGKEDLVIPPPPKNDRV